MSLVRFFGFFLEEMVRGRLIQAARRASPVTSLCRNVLYWKEGRKEGEKEGSLRWRVSSTLRCRTWPVQGGSAVAPDQVPQEVPEEEPRKVPEQVAQQVRNSVGAVTVEA